MLQRAASHGAVFGAFCVENLVENEAEKKAPARDTHGLRLSLP
jgi:hypothetical protein